MQLLMSAKQGDSQALGELIEQCQPYLLLIANQDLSPELHGKFGASDLVQETMLVAYQKIGQFRGQSPAEFKGWLRQILHNDLLRVRRRYLSTQRRDVGREHRMNDSQHFHSPLPDQADTPGTAALAAEEARILQQAMQQLPENYRQAVWMREWEDRSYSEIGNALGVSEEAARKLCRRALDKLEEYLKPIWSDPKHTSQGEPDKPGQSKDFRHERRPSSD